jgi:ataxia telangiectasia mutated family protein
VAESSGCETQTTYRWQLEEARLLWQQGEADAAKSSLRSLLHLMAKDIQNGNRSCNQYSQALRLYGSWLAETKSESPAVIMDRYLSKAIQVASSGESARSGVSATDSSAAHLELARFADAQYQHVVDYSRSSTFESKQALMNKAKNDARQLRQIGEQKR